MKVCFDVLGRHHVVGPEEYVNIAVKVCQHEPPLFKVSLEFIVLLWFYASIGVSGLIFYVQDIHQ